MVLIIQHQVSAHRMTSYCTSLNISIAPFAFWLYLYVRDSLFSFLFLYFVFGTTNFCDVCKAEILQLPASNLTGPAVSSWQ